MNITHRERRGKPYSHQYDCMDCHGTERDQHGRCAFCGSEAIYETASITPGYSGGAELVRQIMVPGEKV